MAKSRVKMEGQLAEDFSNLMYALTQYVGERNFDELLSEINVSWDDYEDIKEYLYDKYEVVTNV